MMPKATHRAGIMALTAILVGSVAAAQDSSALMARRQLDAARQLLAAGALLEAESIYVFLIATIPGEQRALRGDAYFGRAVTAHHRLRQMDTPSVPLTDTILRAYDEARVLNPSELALFSTNNMALVHRVAGRHGDALRLFNEAASNTPLARRAPFLVNAGVEHEALGNPRGAAAAYAAALRSDSSSTEALAALLRTLEIEATPRDLLGTANQWRTRDVHADVILNALADLLAREAAPPTAAEARTALVYLASVLPSARVGPPSFDGLVRDRLRRGSISRPEIAPGVNALLDAYRLRKPSDTYSEPASAGWWREAPENGRAVWSSVLRSIGEYYDAQGAQAVARTYYEQAIGLGSASLNEPWIDRKAVMPLALIYASSDTQRAKADQLQREVDRFSEAIFSAKGMAYARGDIEQIRDFHMTLGAIYAARGLWTGSGARSAEFQLENMRRATRELAQREGRQVVDPPDLLEKLAVHYANTGRAAKAEEVKAQVKADYARKGKPALGDSAVKRIERTRVPPTSRTVPTAQLAPVPSGAATEARLPVTTEPASSAANRAAVSAVAGGRGTVLATAVSGPVTEIVLSDGASRRPLAKVTVTATINGREERLETDAEGVIRVRVAVGVDTVQLRLAVPGYSRFVNTYKVGSKVSALMRRAPQE